ncbi:MAG: hypothetical protein HND49_20100 [Planctomycetes bacterium]|nr:hypothetical protein [Planctomycetota bacterium]
MLVRIFFSFNRESDEKDPIVDLKMCTDLKTKVLSFLREHSNDFDYFFYREEEKNLRDRDHLDACDFSNYFIIFFFGDPYLRSLNCRKEYYWFQKNTAFPKSPPHVVYKNEATKKKLEDLTNLTYFQNRKKSEWEELEGIIPFDNREIYPNGFQHTSSDLVPERNDLTVGEREIEKNDCYAKHISDKLKSFLSVVYEKLQQQILVGGYKAISKEEKEALCMVFKEHNKEIFLSPFFIKLDPLMPGVQHELDLHVWRKLTEERCIKEVREIYWFINIDVGRVNDINTSLEMIANECGKRTKVTVVSHKKLTKAITNNAKLTGFNFEFLTRHNLSENQDGVLERK